GWGGGGIAARASGIGGCGGSGTISSGNVSTTLAAAPFVPAAPAAARSAAAACSAARRRASSTRLIGFPQELKERETLPLWQHSSHQPGVLRLGVGLAHLDE